MSLISCESSDLDIDTVGIPCSARILKTKSYAPYASRYGCVGTSRHKWLDEVDGETSGIQGKCGDIKS